MRSDDERRDDENEYAHGVPLARQPREGGCAPPLASCSRVSHAPRYDFRSNRRPSEALAKPPSSSSASGLAVCGSSSRVAPVASAGLVAEPVPTGGSLRYAARVPQAEHPAVDHVRARQWSFGDGLTGRLAASPASSDRRSRARLCRRSRDGSTPRVRSFE